jgi:hypothetical protein
VALREVDGIAAPGTATPPLAAMPDAHQPSCPDLDAGGGAQALGMKPRVSHAGAIAEEVQHAFGRLGGRSGIGAERVDNDVQFAVAQFRAAHRCPCFGFVSRSL